MTIEPKLKRSGPQYRDEALDRAAVDPEKRTVRLSFSSEAPVKRWFGEEILDHAKGSVRMSRLNSHHPLLVNHNTDDQVGVIESASVEKGRGMATVRFGNSARAEEIFNDVKDGIRRLVSVGYRIWKADRVKVDGDEETYRVTDWEPMEISLVPIPADGGVGVGRAGGQAEENEVEVTDKTNMKRSINLDPGDTGGGATTEPNLNPPAAPQPAPAQPAQQSGGASGGAAFTRAEVLAEVQRSERARIAEIEAIAAEVADRVPDAQALAKRARDENHTGNQFRQVIWQALFGGGAGAQKPVQSPNPLIGMSRQDISQYSFRKAIIAAHSGKLEGLEGECHRAALKQYDTEPRNQNSIIVPYDVLSAKTMTGNYGTRDQLVGTASLGGNLVETQLLAQSFIEVLRNRMMVARMGATMMDGLVGNIAIPRQTNQATLYWMASETAAVTESTLTFDQVTLSPKQAHARIDYSWLLLKQSTPSIEGIVRNDLTRVMALGIDRAALHGPGTAGQPLGIAAVSGIGSVAGGTAGAIPTWANIVALETAVAVDNADMGSLGYLINAGVRGALKTIEKSTSTGLFLWMDTPLGDGMGMLNGYKVGVSNQVANNLTKGTATTVASAIFFGDWSSLLIGSWGGLELSTNPYSQMSNRVIEVHCWQAVDVAVRHPESFAVMLDALTA